MATKSRQNATGSVHSATPRERERAADSGPARRQCGARKRSVGQRALTILVVPMRSRVLRRRSATALGVYLATALGFLTTVVATRELGVADYARFAAILAATAFFQVLLDLTVEEALVKYGFRYVETEQLGTAAADVRGRARVQARRRRARPGSRSPRSRRSRRQVWGVGGVLVPMLIAALLPLVQAPEAVAGGAIILRGRYDVRGCVLRRLDGRCASSASASACTFGLDGAVIGMVARAGRRDRGDLDRRARRVPPLPAGAARSRSATTAATCGGS